MRAVTPPASGCAAAFVFVLLLCASGALVARAVYLQLVNPEFFIKKGDARSMREVPTQAGRATHLRSRRRTAGRQHSRGIGVRGAAGNRRRSGTLEGPGARAEARSARIQPAHLAQPGPQFPWLARHLKPKEAEAVRELGIPGVYFRQEWARYYPQTEVTSHVLGITDIDDHGPGGHGAGLGFAARRPAGPQACTAGSHGTPGRGRGEHPRRAAGDATCTSRSTPASSTWRIAN